MIENKGGHRFFYNDKAVPIEREKDLHVLYRLVWFGTPSEAEANDGRGHVDFKISRGTEKRGTSNWNENTIGVTQPNNQRPTGK